MNIASTCRLAVLALVISLGCQPSMQTSDLTTCPDGPVEVVELSDQELVHSTSRFLAEIQRTDDKLVIVDFWATWCGPCRQLGPQLDLVKKEWKDKVTLVKVDIDENQPLANFFNVSAIPQVQIFQGGKSITGFRGVQSAAQISSLLKSLQ